MASTADHLPWCLDPDLEEWRATMRDFADRHVAPLAGSEEVQLELIERIAATGVLGLRVSEEAGGSAAGVVSLCLAVEELARHDSSIAATIHALALSAALLDYLGSREQTEEILPSVIAGKKLICVALTEPTSGSDAGNIATHAERDGSDWLITGSKQFITNCGTKRSSHVIVFAATAPGSRPERPGVSAFLVPLGHPGVEVGTAPSKLGWRGSDTHPIYFDRARVPAASLLGPESGGYREALRFLTWGRLPFCALAVGLAQGCLDETTGFVSERESFGRLLGSHQAVAFALAEMAGKVASARLLTYDASWRFDHGQRFEQQTAVAKMVVPELANRVAYSANHLHGGYGIVEESAVARHFRDARVLTVGEGTTEMQRMLVARGLGLPA